MKLADSAIKNPVTTSMIAIALILFGIIGATRMNVDLFPNITLPSIIVATVYPGAGPLEVESKVTNILEQRLGTTPNLSDITSRSAENVSIITMQMAWGSNLDAASSDIRDRLDQAVGYLPDEAQKPFVLKLESSMMPIIQMTMSGNIPVTELSDIADDVSKALQRIPGVAAVMVIGSRMRQVQIMVDQRELTQAGITLDQFALMLQAQNLNYPVGSVSTKEQKYLLRLMGQYDNLEQIRNTVIGNKGFTPILVRQVADVHWAPEEEKSYVRTNNKNTIYLSVQRRPDANTIKVANDVRSEMDNIKQTLPSSVQFNVFYDSSESIKTSVNDVVKNLFIGGILAIAIIFIFLRRFRATMFVAFAIPVSVLFALFFMYIFGFSINILSMSGLAIAIGMIVDDAIVVFESIFRHREWGDDDFKAASVGTSEVGMAVVASTLTTLAVFFPLLLLRGFMQIFFRELSWVIIFSMSASLGVAVTLVPMLTSRYLKLPPPGTEEKGFMGWSERMYKNLEAFYGRTIGWGLRHRKLVFWGTIGIFIVTLMIVPFLKTEFMPEQESRIRDLTLEMPIGSNLAVTNQSISQLEKYVLDKWSSELDGMLTQVGEATSVYAQIFGQARTNTGTIDILVKKGSKHSALQIEQDIRKKASDIPGLIVRASRTRSMTAFFGSGAPIQVDILGDNIQTGDSLANLIISKINTIPGIVDLKSSREKGDPEIQMVVDRVKAAGYGLSPYQIGSTLRTQLEGNAATKYRISGKEYDILIRLREDQRNDMSRVLSTTINGPMGPVLLKNVVVVNSGTSPLQVEHKNTGRIVSVTGNVVGQSAGRLSAKVKNAIRDISAPGFEIKVSGSYADMMKSFKDLGFVTLIAVVLVFMVMASQFESIREPFIILFTIPLAVIGVIWMLLITGTALSLISGLGVLILVGVVTKNGIVYIDYCNQLRRRESMELEVAAKRAGQIRMRPIIMTALTTMFGLIPLALKIGEGSELWSPLGRAVIGGLFVSTFLTLIFIPVMYVTFERRRMRRAQKA